MHEITTLTTSLIVFPRATYGNIREYFAATDTCNREVIQARVYAPHDILIEGRNVCGQALIVVCGDTQSFRRRDGNPIDVAENRMIHFVRELKTSGIEANPMATRRNVSAVATMRVTNAKGQAAVLATVLSAALAKEEVGGGICDAEVCANNKTTAFVGEEGPDHVVIGLDRCR